MLINGHRDRTFYQFPSSSMTFHVLPWVLPVRSTTFQPVPRPFSQFYDLFQQTLRREDIEREDIEREDIEREDIEKGGH